MGGCGSEHSRESCLCPGEMGGGLFADWYRTKGGGERNADIHLGTDCWTHDPWSRKRKKESRRQVSAIFQREKDQKGGRLHCTNRGEE